MKKTIDLHIHSTFSEDGDLSVAEIFNLAEELSLSAISITDHDSIESISEAKKIKEDFNVEYITGTEITTVFPEDGSQQHILGYCIDENNNDIKHLLKRIYDLRLSIAKKRIAALKKIGFHLQEERIWEMNRNRPPTANSIMIELLNNENNRSNKDLEQYHTEIEGKYKLIPFYLDYLTEGKSAYIPFESVSVKEGIDAIKKAGGIPVLAHPAFLKKREWLDIIVGYGIQGIEAISTYHREEDISFYIDYAEKKSLLVTAGSDFHGPTTKPNVKLGGIAGNDYKYFELLVEALK